MGAVDVREHGRQRLYRLNGRALEPIHDWVKEYERFWSDRFDELDGVLDELKREEERDDDDDGGTATVTLPADDQILITRAFAAPRHLVYRAWTTPRARPALVAREPGRDERCARSTYGSAARGATCR